MRQLLARPLAECLLTEDKGTLPEISSFGEACWFDCDFGDVMKAEVRRAGDSDKAEGIGDASFGFISW